MIHLRSSRFGLIELISGLLLAFSMDVSALAAEKYLLFVGTYTGGSSQGIYTMEFDAETGVLSNLKLAVKTDNPSFLAIHPSEKFVFAVNELTEYEGKPTGAVSAFAFDAKTRELKRINQQATGGGAPCHISLDDSGKFALVANYAGGSVTSFPIADDGRLQPAVSLMQHVGKGVDNARQEAPHAHSIFLNAKNDKAYAADLGVDKIMIYSFDSKSGALRANEPPFATVDAGSGPRHFAFHPNGKWAFTNGEMKTTLIGMKLDASNGSLAPYQTLSTLPEDFKEDRRSTADLHVHPSGKFIYVSNRGHDSIAVFSCDTASGKLALVEIKSAGGAEPRNIALVPGGKWLIAEHQNSDSAAVFAIDELTGKLTKQGENFHVPSPVCIKMVRLTK